MGPNRYLLVSFSNYPLTGYFTKSSTRSLDGEKQFKMMCPMLQLQSNRHGRTGGKICSSTRISSSIHRFKPQPLILTRPLPRLQTSSYYALSSHDHSGVPFDSVQRLPRPGKVQEKVLYIVDGPQLPCLAGQGGRVDFSYAGLKCCSRTR